MRSLGRYEEAGECNYCNVKMVRGVCHCATSRHVSKLRAEVKKKLDVTSATKPRQCIIQFGTTGSVDGGAFIKVIAPPPRAMKHTVPVQHMNLNQLVGVRVELSTWTNSNAMQVI